MKEILLSRGLTAFVDDDDYDRLNKYKWHAHNHKIRFYAARSEIKSVGGKRDRKIIYMHREVVHPPRDGIIDHINGNGLDNRKSNLRVGDQRQNLQHMQRIRSDLPHGVLKLRGRNKYNVRPFFNGKYYWLGSYNTPEEAETVYRVACIFMTGRDVISRELSECQN